MSLCRSTHLHLLHQGIPDCSAIPLNFLPKSVDAYSNRGLAKFRKCDYDKAISDYNEALKLNPESYQVYYDRGFAQYGNGDYDKATADFSEAIRLNPGCAEAYLERGIL
ncbi:MAG: tetratricopeptide repeat protein [Candidatus Xenobiia bacterium LiM19]